MPIWYMVPEPECTGPLGNCFEAEQPAPDVAATSLLSYLTKIGIVWALDGSVCMYVWPAPFLLIFPMHA